jgi:hypothetical protein
MLANPTTKMFASKQCAQEAPVRKYLLMMPKERINL